MSSAPTGALLRHIHRLAGAPRGQDRSDGELLRRFVSLHEAAAFNELLGRHGPLVWGVCRRVLGREHEAEDAFQATFLVLARRARFIHKTASLSSFLYGVAYRVAVRLRRQAGRRRTCERRVDIMPPTDVVTQVTLHELQVLLDEELNRLPEKYRAPVVLCCLEGKGRAEAARELGWKEGTLSSRLAEARRRLLQRLSRRGVALGTVFCAIDLGKTAPAAVPAALMEATAKTALSAACGQVAPVSAAAAAAAQGVLRSLSLGPWKVVGALLLAAGVACAVVGAPGQPPDKKSPPPSQPARPALAPAARAAGLDRYGDPLPEGAIARFGSLRLHHGFLVNAVAVSPDGKTLASGGGGRGLCLWDLATGKLLHEVVPTRHVYGVAFSPDGKLLAGSEGVRVLHLWDVASGKEVRRLDGNDGGVTMTVAFSPDGKTLASGGHDKLVRLWDVATGAELRQLRGAEGTIRSVAFSPDGRLVAAGGAGKEVRLWDAATGAARGTLAGHNGNAWWIAFSPDGRTLASGGDDKTLRLWDVAGRKERTVLGGEATGEVEAVAFSPDGKVVASGHSGGAVRLWDGASCGELRSIQAHALRSNALAFTPDGKTLVSGALWGSTVRLWDVATGREHNPLGGPHGTVSWLQFAADGRSLFVAARDRVVRRWEWARDAESTIFSWDTPSMFDTQVLTAAGPLVASYDYKSRGISVWGADGGRPLQRFDHPGANFALALSPDGRLLASGGKDRTLRLWDLQSGKEIRRAEGLEDEASALVFSPDGKSLAAGSSNLGTPGPLRGKGLRLWDTTTLKEVRAFDSSEDVFRVAFSPDGTLLACLGGPYPHRARLWDVATGNEQPLPPALRRSFGLAFSPDSKLLLVGTEEPENAAVVVEIASGQEVRRFVEHMSGVSAGAFSPDGKLLATGGGDANVVLWDLAGKGAAVALDAGKCWAALADTDAARAHAAVRELAADPQRAVAFLRDRLRPVAPLDASRRRQEERWLADLDSDTFAVRKRAAQELEGLGDLAEPALREALRGRPTPEGRRQMESILEGSTGWSTPRLRVARAVMALESAGTPAARHLLQEAASGAPGALLTRQARAALDRLEKRPVAR
jgi:RNA polymerase sigma factor (sigma-70 family)